MKKRTWMHKVRLNDAQPNQDPKWKARVISNSPNAWTCNTLGFEVESTRRLEPRFIFRGMHAYWSRLIQWVSKSASGFWGTNPRVHERTCRLKGKYSSRGRGPKNVEKEIFSKESAATILFIPYQNFLNPHLCKVWNWVIGLFPLT